MWVQVEISVIRVGTGENQCDTVWVQVEISVIRVGTGGNQCDMCGYRWKSV